MLGEVLRFHRAARRVLDGTSPLDEDATFGAFLAHEHFSRFFVDTFAVPVVSAVWSSGPELSMQYPARYLFAFLDNHGLLSVGGSHQWKTVVGGSARYVERAVKGLSAVEVSTPVRAVRRDADGVAVRDDADVERRFDRVVVATHSPHRARPARRPDARRARRARGVHVLAQRDLAAHRHLPAASGGRGAGVVGTCCACRARSGCSSATT